MEAKKTRKKRKPIGKNKGGRPTKYKATYCGQVYKLCLLGATDKDIADFFEVTESTINLWKTTYYRFSESIKKGKKLADMIVAESLFQRSKGATVKKQTAIKVRTTGSDENGKRYTKEEIQVINLKEQIPPDTTAMIFWLKNRHSKEWRDKQEVEVTVNPFLELMKKATDADNDRT